MSSTIKFRRDNSICGVPRTLAAQRTQIQTHRASGAGLRGSLEARLEGPAFQRGAVVAGAENSDVEGVGCG